MSEAFEKQLSKCWKIHLWTGFFNVLVLVVAALTAAAMYVLVTWVPQIIDSPDLYTDEQRVAFKQNYVYLKGMAGVVMSFPVLALLMVFLAFHVGWCIRRGRYYRYCLVASWLQGLNVPVGTPAAVVAMKLLYSAEGKAHFGRPGSAPGSASGGAPGSASGKGDGLSPMDKGGGGGEKGRGQQEELEMQD
jgi:hypothetical protein